MKHLTWPTLTAVLMIASSAFCGGELTHAEIQRMEHNAVAQQLGRHYLGRQRALAMAEMDAAAAVEYERHKLNRLTFAAPAAKDKYGDPMYTFYGPLPYTSSPEFVYHGPRYVASFDRFQMLPLPDGEYRGYYRQAFSNPTLTARTDTSLGIGASQSYFQSGMMVHPGSMAPSAARVMTNNRW